MSVPKCVGCNEKLEIDDLGLCKACEENLRKTTDRNCSRCAKQINLCSCAPKYLRDNKVYKLVKCYRYIINERNFAQNNLIFSLKKDNRRDVIARITETLCHSIINSYPDYRDCIITNVPRRRVSIKKYGYDHSAALAKSVAKNLKVKYISLVSSLSKTQQKELRSEERLKNAKFVIKRNAEQKLKKKKIILIDDIITTGASVGNCAKVLRKAGAGKIYAACIAIAYRDEYTPPQKLWFE